MRNILVFYNPYSGRKTKTNHLRMLTGEIEKIGDCFEVISEDPNTLSTLPDPKGQPADLVIVLGGDGTVRAVARLILESGSEAPVAVIPAGSGNLFAFALRIPSRVKKAVKLALGGMPIEIDVGRLNNKDCFLIAFALGYVTEFVVNTPRSIKKHLGIFAYVLYFFKNLKISKSKFEISVDGERHIIEGNTILVVDALRVLGSRPRKEISFTDGLLNLIILTNKNLAGFFDAFLYYFFSLNTRKNFVAAHGRKIAIVLENEGAVAASLDGDEIELRSKKVELEISEKKLKVISRIPQKDN